MEHPRHLIPVIDTAAIRDSKQIGCVGIGVDRHIMFFCQRQQCLSALSFCHLKAQHGCGKYKPKIGKRPFRFFQMIDFLELHQNVACQQIFDDISPTDIHLGADHRFKVPLQKLRQLAFDPVVAVSLIQTSDKCDLISVTGASILGLFQNMFDAPAIHRKRQIIHMRKSHAKEFIIITFVKQKKIVAGIIDRTMIHTKQRTVAGPADIFDAAGFAYIGDHAKIIHREHKIIRPLP